MEREEARRLISPGRKKRIAEHILATLEPLTEDEREYVFERLNEEYCSLCHKKLNGRTCYCAPGYDE